MTYCVDSMALRCERLGAIPWLQHGFYTRKGGVSRGIYESLNCGLGSQDAPLDVLENRARIARDLSADASCLITPYQHHSCDVVTLTPPLTQNTPKGDALVSRHSGIVLGISTADCGSLLFCDPKAKVIGAAHAGWRGAFGGIVENTIAAMQALGAHSHNMIAVLGPTISQKNYEVGAEFYEKFIDQQADNHAFFVPAKRAGHFLFDLPAYILSRLKHQNVHTAINLNLCTYENESLFFSYRRMRHQGEADYGRLLSALMITPPAPKQSNRPQH